MEKEQVNKNTLPEIPKAAKKRLAETLMQLKQGEMALQGMIATCLDTLNLNPEKYGIDMRNLNNIIIAEIPKQEPPKDI